MVKEGQLAPKINLLGDDNKNHTLETYLGKNIVIFFYPKDSTPGCTREACGFRDSLDDLTTHSTIVFGISRDSIESHKRFKEKYDLNFTLLSDPDLSAHQSFGALEDQKTIRSTFIINKAGKIAKIWRAVKVDGHVEEVLQSIIGDK